MRRVNLEAYNQSYVEINLSPLIDMMFLLLIFFIVTTAFIEEVGIDVERPTASTSETLEKESIIIGISKDGKIVYGDREISLNSVRGIVSRIIHRKERPVIIVVDKHTECARLIDVIDECKAGGAKRISIATQREENI